MDRNLNNDSLRMRTVLLFVAGMALLLLTIIISLFGKPNIGEAMTRNSARLSLLWYWVATAGMLCLSEQDWNVRSARCGLVRWSWTWGVVSFWLHFLVAFHFYHHWSHAKAYEHVSNASNFGSGIYVSYFFTILWSFDVLWWWLQPESFSKRSSWMGWSVHAFMIFIIFNATIVFETGAIRWIGGAILGSLTIIAIMMKSKNRIHSDLAPT